MDERAAIKILRMIIGHEGGICETDGFTDPGWCCPEHAEVAIYAFALSGRRALRCHGKLYVLTRNSDIVQEISPHAFVTDDARRIFDSSVTLEGIEGFGTDQQKPVPGTQVFAGEDEPDMDRLYDRLLESPCSRYLCYVVEKCSIVLEPATGALGGNPFQDWLVDLIGAQKGLWAKAAWLVREALEGRSPTLEGTRDKMWKTIAGSPDRQQEVAQALLALKLRQ